MCETQSLRPTRWKRVRRPEPLPFSSCGQDPDLVVRGTFPHPLQLAYCIQDATDRRLSLVYSVTQETRREPDGVHLIGRAAPSAGVVLLRTSR